MQHLILAHALDGGAHAVADELAPRLGKRLSVLRPECLGQAQWSQQVDGRGRARTRICWHGGHSLESGQIGFVWNRIRMLPQAGFRASTAQDQDYAGAELQALVASWLAGLGERAEPPMRRHATVTAVPHHLHWAAAASRCGFTLVTRPSAPVSFSVLSTPMELCGAATTTTATVTATWPPALACACQALAGQLGFSLLELGFSGTLEAPLLCHVNTHPALASEGEVQAVARWLAGRAEGLAKPEPRVLGEALT